MNIFAAKLSEENNAVYVGSISNIDDTVSGRLLDIKRRTGEEPVLLDEHSEKAEFELASKLRELGYRVYSS